MIKFDWDKNKANINQKKHGIHFSEAITVFGDPLELTVSDPTHSEGEYRFLSIGKSAQGKFLVVSYVEKRENYIRIISARQATKQEQKNYEDNNRYR